MNKLGIRLRDVLFGGIGGAILYHEVAVVDTAEPILVFAAFFLLGLIPASRADEAAGATSFKGLLKSWLQDAPDPSPPEDKSKKDKSK